MLILFDFENIQNVHYQAVKQLIIKKFGRWDWEQAKKIGAVAEGNEPFCLKDWNSNIMIFRVINHPQAADDKLVEIAGKEKGNRCVVVSNDNVLFRRVQTSRIEMRNKYVSLRGIKKTKTLRICFQNDELVLENPNPHKKEK
ncbi:MAG: hypothetical protein ACYDD5_04230 [Sulfuricurvum sp.]